MLKAWNPTPPLAGVVAVASSSSPQRRAPPKALAPPPVRRPDGDRCAPWSRPAPPPPQLPLSVEAPPAAATAAGEPRGELDAFLELVPPRMRRALAKHAEIGELVEVVLDLGRRPIARFPSGDWVISDEPVAHGDLGHAVSKVGEFSEDNRSGIDRSLHRISAIRNRKMQIIGLTCRVGRAVSGSAEMIRDLIEGGGSILVIGPPGVGKTTLIREIARILADENMKRVVIVDTSNEIGGDGDVPHSGIGRSRRMQVPKVSLQHNVMIEAVENHMPEVIVIDEIGTELEALAASTIAQRGVQLVGTAHGVTIESIIKNPCLQSLVGGIESVTLGDEEARKRKVQKTILERKGPPTFSCAIELISKTECRVHHKLEATVDAILAGKAPAFELRKLDSKGSAPQRLLIGTEPCEELGNEVLSSYMDRTDSIAVPSEVHPDVHSGSLRKVRRKMVDSNSSPVLVYTYKISEADILQVASVMGFEDKVDVTDDIGTANVILASSSELKQNPWIRSIAKYHQLPIFVIKANTMAQMVKAIKLILGEDMSSTPPSRKPDSVEGDFEVTDDAPARKPSLEELDALEEARLAIEYIVIPGGEPVELLPRCSEIIARQLELVQSYQLAAETSGTEMWSRLQILPVRTGKKSLPGKSASSSSAASREAAPNGNAGASVPRLPFLPE